MHRSVSAILFVILMLSPLQCAAGVDFASQVQPIFMKNCAGCHGEEKKLGGLRLHSAEGIQEKAAADDHLIVAGKPEESELYERVTLPADHKKFMPKQGKPLTEAELKLIHDWIAEGAKFEVIAEAAKPKPQEQEAVAPMPKELPLPEVEAANAAALDKLAAAGAQISTLYADSPLLQVSFALRTEPAADADIKLLQEVAGQLYALNLAKAQVSEAGMSHLAQLENLSQLHLENSSVTDAGLQHLSKLVRLEYLNLYGTEISDAGLKHLEGLKHLRKLYLWQTSASYESAMKLQELIPGLLVDLGYDHPVVARMRLTKQLEQAKQQLGAADSTLQNTQAALDRAKEDQAAAQKWLDEVQSQLDELEGKAEDSQPAESDQSEADKA